MIDFAECYRAIADTTLAPWIDRLPKLMQQGLDVRRHGDLPRWEGVLQQLLPLKTANVELKYAVAIGEHDEITALQRETIEQLLRQFHPWRKGPFELYGISIDTEWRSDWKWQRVLPHITSLAGRKVLDVGCGNGYHCWRIAGEGAELVLGIDPSPLFVMQFRAIRHFMATPPAVHVLPLRLEQLPQRLPVFDTVFSMGVLYHRRSPLDHLMALKECLRPGGELVLETLVIDGGPQQVLMPEGRYSKMGNVWFIPSVAALVLWLQRLGFREARVADLNRTSTEEQRSTEWMTFESLKDFLNFDDKNFTVEGYPAPKRAVVVAKKPG